MLLTGENWRTWRETCPSATLFTTNLTRTDPDANPVLCNERPVTNRVSHGTAILAPWISRVVTAPYKRECAWSEYNTRVQQDGRENTVNSVGNRKRGNCKFGGEQKFNYTRKWNGTWVQKVDIIGVCVPEQVPSPLWPSTTSTRVSLLWSSLYVVMRTDVLSLSIIMLAYTRTFVLLYGWCWNKLRIRNTKFWYKDNAKGRSVLYINLNAIKSEVLSDHDVLK
jgi:hypothetical protein